MERLYRNNEIVYREASVSHEFIDDHFANYGFCQDWSSNENRPALSAIVEKAITTDRAP